MRKVRSPLPLRVTEALAKLGTDLKNLRARRRMPMAYAADRVSISRSTLHKVERGDPNVSLGIYAALLHSYGMLERLESLAEARWDRTGLALEESRLPQRIHS
jgi:transcriptional regulator with XRE-family HTH domain